MEIDKLTKEFLATGQQPNFKNGFDFTILTPTEDGADLLYFNLDEVPKVTIDVDTGKIIVDNEKSVLICLTDVPNEDIPKIVVNVAKKQI